jgi:hypothetical protein
LGEFLVIFFRNNIFILYVIFVGFSGLAFSFYLFRFIILVFKPIIILIFSTFQLSIFIFVVLYFFLDPNSILIFFEVTKAPPVFSLIFIKFII